MKEYQISQFLFSHSLIIISHSLNEIYCIIESLTFKQIISYEEGKALGAELGVDYIEISAKTGLNVNEAFMMISEKIVES